MRFSVCAICLVLLHVNLVYSFGSDNVVRVKRSNETEGFTLQKISDGVKSFGSRLSNVATKGYEEMKNLFSSKRKVGDYTLNNIDVRVRDEEDYEEVSVKRPKRDAKLEDTDEISVDFVVNLDDLMKDMKVLETTKRPRTTTLKNNAELRPGLPPQHSIIIAPLICPPNMKFINGRCRTIS